MAGVAYVFTNTDVRVKLDQGWFTRQGLPGGATYETARDANRAAFHHLRLTIQSRHSRSGTLARSMRTDMSKRGRSNVYGLVRSTAEHAEWFFYGTQGPIWPSGWTEEGGAAMLRLEDPAGYSPMYKAHFKTHVAGQSAKVALLDNAVRVGVARVASGPVPKGPVVRF